MPERLEHDGVDYCMMGFPRRKSSAWFELTKKGPGGGEALPGTGKIVDKLRGRKERLWAGRGP